MPLNSQNFKQARCSSLHLIPFSWSGLCLAQVAMIDSLPYIHFLKTLSKSQCIHENLLLRQTNIRIKMYVCFILIVLIFPLVLVILVLYFLWESQALDVWVHNLWAFNSSAVFNVRGGKVLIMFHKLFQLFEKPNIFSWFYVLWLSIGICHCHFNISGR